MITLGKLRSIIVIEEEPPFDAKYFYAPYIPIMVGEVFAPREGIASRYSNTIINNSFYGVIRVSANRINLGNNVIT